MARTRESGRVPSGWDRRSDNVTGGVAVDRVSPAVDDHVVVARAPGGEVIRVGVAVVSLMANVTGLESVMGATPAEVGHRATLGV